MAWLPDGVRTEVVAAGSPLQRVHWQDRGPLWFGPAPGDPPSSRWDAPAGEFRTLYCALELKGSFVESVLHRPAGRIIKLESILRRAWTTFHFGRDLRLAQLHGAGLLANGVDLPLVAEGSYRRTRELALAIWQADPSVDGISYRSGHNDSEICVALFDRVPLSAIRIDRTISLRELAPGEITALLLEHGAVLDTSAAIPDYGDWLEEERRATTLRRLFAPPAPPSTG